MIAQFPLRTKFLGLLLLGVLAVTGAILLVVRHAIENQVREQIFDDLSNSVRTFRTFQSERESTLSHTVELLADLPTLKAVMTTNDMATIQDASAGTWNLSGSDLLALAVPDGKVMAVHAAAALEISTTAVQEAFTSAIRRPENKQWWFLQGHLYEVFLRPVYFGPSGDNRLLGVLALGYEINGALARDVNRIAGSQVTFLYGNTVVATTLSPSRRADFARNTHSIMVSDDIAPVEFQLGNERYLGTSVQLAPGSDQAVRLSVLKSYDEATAHFSGLYRSLVALGILALLGQGLLAIVIFSRYTRPLEELVAAVRALGKGNFDYPLDARGKDELAEAKASFIRTRDDLRLTQRKLLESERLATIGRMASSISHDLRHQLTSIMANSEFLAEPNLHPEQSEELYEEVRDAVGRMTELIDSLLEFSRGKDALSLSWISLESTMQRAMRSVYRHPSVQNAEIRLSCLGNREGWFDSRRLERVFYNLLLNACQAAAPHPGQVDVSIQEAPQAIEILVSDQGPGIPEPIREKIFEPFVSYAREHGTGLGLTIVQKIVEEHGGTIRLADSSPGHTTFEIKLPLVYASEAEVPEDLSSVKSSNTHSAQLRD